MSLRMWARDGDALSIGRQSETGLRIKVIKFIIMQFWAYGNTIKSLPVTKQKDTTRSHPEHGRKDFSRRQYSEGSLPGR